MPAEITHMLYTHVCVYSLTQQFRHNNNCQFGLSYYFLCVSTTRTTFDVYYGENACGLNPSAVWREVCSE